MVRGSQGDTFSTIAYADMLEKLQTTPAGREAMAVELYATCEVLSPPLAHGTASSEPLQEAASGSFSCFCGVRLSMRRRDARLHDTRTTPASCTAQLNDRHTVCDRKSSSSCRCLLLSVILEIWSPAEELDLCLNSHHRQNRCAFWHDEQHALHVDSTPLLVGQTSPQYTENFLRLDDHSLHTGCGRPGGLLFVYDLT